MQEEPNKYVKELTQEKYKYGFTTEVHTDIIERGLNEDVIRLISAKKNEPEWLLEFRLKAYRYWLTMEMPAWAHLTIPEIDYQAISYYADPTKKKEGPKSMDEVDPELIKTFNKLGIPLEEQMALSGMAVDAVMDSVSVKTTFKETLLEKGIIFCSFSEAVREHPDLVKKYLGSVVGPRDNFFAALNSAVFSDGSFVYIPKGVRCPSGGISLRQKGKGYLFFNFAASRLSCSASWAFSRACSSRAALLRTSRSYFSTSLRIESIRR